MGANSSCVKTDSFYSRLASCILHVSKPFASKALAHSLGLEVKVVMAWHVLANIDSAKTHFEVSVGINHDRQLGVANQFLALVDVNRDTETIGQIAWICSVFAPLNLVRELS